MADVDPLSGPARRSVLRVAPSEKGSIGGGSRVGHAFQIALVIFALFWLTVGFGVIDLVSGFTPPYNGTNVLSSAYGAIAAVVLPLALFAQLRARQTSVAALQVIAAVALSFALAAVLALDPLSLISVATLAAMLVVLLWLHPSRPRLLQFDRRLNRPLLGLTAVAAVPWGVFALEMAANGRSALAPAAAAARPQAGGWAGATALAVCVVLLGLLSSTRTPGWQVPLWAASLATFTFGVASLVNPVAPGSAGPVWGTLAVAWSAVFVTTAYWSWRRASPIPDRR